MALFVVAAGVLIVMALPAGRQFLFGAQVRRAANDPAATPTQLAGLFGEALKRRLAPGGVDTSLVLAESSVDAAHDGEPERQRFVWEVPLPRSVSVDSAGAAFDAVLGQFSGSVRRGSDAVSTRRSARLRSDVVVEALFLESDARQDGRPRLALLIDEFGHRNLAESDELLDFARGITVAILPYGTGARDYADRCRRKGIEVVVDLPMEDLDYPRIDPGPGAILVDLSEREIRKRVDQAFDRLGGADGVHTYMGNLAVEDRTVMMTVLSQVRRRKVYFLDSTKSKFSSVESIAAGLGVPARRIRGGLDGPRSTTAQMTARLEELAAVARQRGVAVGVVRPYPGTVEALRKLLPAWAASGLEVVPVSEVVTVPKRASDPSR